MNRFRTKKRAKDDLAAGRSSEDSDQSPLSFFRKGKKVQQEEVKKEFDLANALPSDDDFRTSLLMSNLSARFSMLREQDDPNTKIGKASDDSVLFPKRQSRLADFGFGAGSGLSDIAEVESIKDRNLPRTTSVTSDESGSANGTSVLNRSRPTEGNVLFGGRQKIYKIPAASAGGMTGRAVYEDDVALSAFQRWRQSEREKTLEGLTGTTSDEIEEERQSRSESPAPIGSSRKRETVSTTSSGSFRARNSTAATSITSQSTTLSAEREGETQAKNNTADSRTPDRTSTATEDETDEFANQLANARRRVREKLTSYIESDSSRAPSPHPLPTDPSNLSAQSSNPLAILKPKSSRGSLIDRSRNVVPGQSKGLKILGLGAATMSTPTQPGKQSFDEKEIPTLETMKEEVAGEDTLQMGHTISDVESHGDSDPMGGDKDEASQSPALGPANRATPSAMRRPVDKRDISEPTFVTSSSQVPTTTLPHHASHQPPASVSDIGSKSQSDSGEADVAPPVPPINPRRRREDSRAKGPYEDGGMAPPRPSYASQSNHSTPGADHGVASEDESGNMQGQRRRLWKPPPDMQGPVSRPFPGTSRDNSPSFVARGPPVSRSVETPISGAKSSMGVPGAPGGVI
ncbi:uncharacterized protein P884DRAFT_298842 [Thermothelomyces heterothallicus CBS 202.75]|uniref:uncharacterized protein n=1 Tax=Thermothelomyces heterothallicus CBS 202.75 TaxID=1149848 RepID=UPI003742BC2E